jgi:hypothetical protein
MYQEFNRLSGNAKIWIYHAGRELNAQENETVVEAAKRFCMQWKAHGKPLNSSAEIFYNQFLILAVDESLNPVSGCSMDESVYFIKELSAQLHLDFLSRETVTFMDPESKIVSSLPLKEAKEKAGNGEIKGDHLIFNNLVVSKTALKYNWIIPVKESWLKNFLPKKVTL